MDNKKNTEDNKNMEDNKNIKITNFNTPNLSYFNDEKMRNQVLTHILEETVLPFFINLIKLIYFNPDHPENHSVVIDDYINVKIHYNYEWVSFHYKDVHPALINSCVEVMKMIGKYSFKPLNNKYPKETDFLKMLKIMKGSEKITPLMCFNGLMKKINIM